MDFDEGGSLDTPLVVHVTDLTSAEDKEKILDRARQFIRRRFPKVNFKQLGPMGFGHKTDT